MTFPEILQQQYKLSDASLLLLLEGSKTEKYNKKEIVIREGHRDDYIYFVEKGSARGFVERGNKQISLLFAFEGDMATTISGLTGTRTKFSIETLEATTLVKISRAHMENLFQHSIELANWGRKLMEKSMREYEHYFIEYYWIDKGRQYQMLIKEYPKLLQRVSLKEIASYLDITPQTLSRIRAHIK